MAVREALARCHRRRAAPAAAAVPEPLKGAVWGLSGALSATLSCALNVPVVGGVNVRVILQDALTATELPQLLGTVQQSSTVLSWSVPD